MVSPLSALVGFVVLLALVFDYTNGFHDAANSIATVVATKVLRPYQAVLWAAFWNFVAAFCFNVAVAKMIGKGIVQPGAVDVYVVLAALVGAISWNITTWVLGMPTSSSHALMGGLIGAVLVKVGAHGIITAGVTKTLTFIILSPTIGFTLGAALMRLGKLVTKNASPEGVTRWSKGMQLVTSGAYSLGHGMNDAQKTMGVIAVLLVSMAPKIPELQHLPTWIMPPHDLSRIPWGIIIAAHLAIALGTLSGGWRIVRTMGLRITELKPLGGVCAETSAAGTLIGTALAGIPVSTTHAITGAIVGVGANTTPPGVQWRVVGDIMKAWAVTIPAAALMSAAVYYLVTGIIPRLSGQGQGLVAVGVGGLLAYGYMIWHRTVKSGSGQQILQELEQVA
jgi:PiT family inorganic phosphate transporter